MIRTTSYIPAPRQKVWDFVTSPEGINRELLPMLRMTIPRRLRGRTIDDVEAGEKLGRSWILLLGVIPFDYDDIGIAELEPGSRFLERSTMLSMSSWQHERTLADWGRGCRVTDEVTFAPRAGIAHIPGSKRIAAALVERVFAHRHRRLYDHFDHRARPDRS